MQEIIQILIIEDDVLVAHNLKLTLLDFGYDVVDICYTFNQALETIESAKYDIALLDINLGNHFKNTGIDIAQIIANKRKEPFIFITAFSDKDTIQKATVLKPSAYLIKPISRPTVYAAIQTALANQLNKVVPKITYERVDFPDFFFSKVGNKITKILWKDVVLLESIKNYVSIKTIQPQKEYLIRSSLIKIKSQMLPKKFYSDFIMVNRSVFINKNEIIGIANNIVNTAYGNFKASKDCLKNIQVIIKSSTL